MGRTRNYKTRNPHKLVATGRRAGPHESFKRQGRKRGGARNMVREYLDDRDNDYSKQDEQDDARAAYWDAVIDGKEER